MIKTFKVFKDKKTPNTPIKGEGKQATMHSKYISNNIFVKKNSNDKNKYSKNI